MFNAYKVWILIGASVLSAALGAATASWVQNIRYTGIIDARDKAALTEKLEAVAVVETARQKAATDLETARTAYLNDLRVKADEYETRLSALNTGDLRLHIDAECPAAATGMQKAPDTSSRNIPTPARLSDRAARRVLHLEQSIAQHARALKLCQDYALTVKHQFSL